MRLTVVALILGSFLLAWSQDSAACSVDTTRGTYGLVCSGWIAPAAGAPLIQSALSGLVKIDAVGFASATAKVSLGGGIAEQSVTGQSVVNADCTGSVSYDQKINGQPAGKLNIIFHVLDDGKEIRGFSTDPGTVLTCSLRRIRRY